MPLHPAEQASQWSCPLSCPHLPDGLPASNCWVPAAARLTPVSAALSSVFHLLLQALYRFMLPENADVTALSLSPDNTNIVASLSVMMSPGQLLVYANPLVS